MSVGAGSIRRAAKTANAGKKKGTAVPAEGKPAEAAAEENAGGKTESEKAAALKEAAGEKVTTSRKRKEGGEKTGKKAPKVTSGKKAVHTYETYGIGQQLPTYLL